MRKLLINREGILKPVLWKGRKPDTERLKQIQELLDVGDIKDVEARNALIKEHNALLPSARAEQLTNPENYDIPPKKLEDIMAFARELKESDLPPSLTVSDPLLPEKTLPPAPEVGIETLWDKAMQPLEAVKKRTDELKVIAEESANSQMIPDVEEAPLTVNSLLDVAPMPPGGRLARGLIRRLSGDAEVGYPSTYLEGAKGVIAGAPKQMGEGFGAADQFASLTAPANIVSEGFGLSARGVSALGKDLKTIDVVDDLGRVTKRPLSAAGVEFPELATQFRKQQALYDVLAATEGGLNIAQGAAMVPGAMQKMEEAYQSALARGFDEVTAAKIAHAFWLSSMAALPLVGEVARQPDNILNTPVDLPESLRPANVARSLKRLPGRVMDLPGQVRDAFNNESQVPRPPEYEIGPLLDETRHALAPALDSAYQAATESQHLRGIVDLPQEAGPDLPPPPRMVRGIDEPMPVDSIEGETQYSREPGQKPEDAFYLLSKKAAQDAPDFFQPREEQRVVRQGQKIYNKVTGAFIKEIPDIETVTPGSTSTEQVLSYLKKRGVSDDELDWTDLEENLRKAEEASEARWFTTESGKKVGLQKGALTKEDVINAIRDPEIRWRKLSESSAENWKPLYEEAQADLIKMNEHNARFASGEDDLGARATSLAYLVTGKPKTLNRIARLLYDGAAHLNGQMAPVARLYSRLFLQRIGKADVDFKSLNSVDFQAQYKELGQLASRLSFSPETQVPAANDVHFVSTRIERALQLIGENRSFYQMQLAAKGLDSVEIFPYNIKAPIDTFVQNIDPTFTNVEETKDMQFMYDLVRTLTPSEARNLFRTAAKVRNPLGRTKDLASAKEVPGKITYSPDDYWFGLRKPKPIKGTAVEFPVYTTHPDVSQMDESDTGHYGKQTGGKLIGWGNGAAYQLKDGGTTFHIVEMQSPRYQDVTRITDPATIESLKSAIAGDDSPLGKALTEQIETMLGDTQKNPKDRRSAKEQIDAVTAQTDKLIKIVRSQGIGSGRYVVPRKSIKDRPLASRLREDDLYEPEPELVQRTVKEILENYAPRPRSGYFSQLHLINSLVTPRVIFGDAFFDKLSWVSEAILNKTLGRYLDTHLPNPDNDYGPSLRLLDSIKKSLVTGDDDALRRISDLLSRIGGEAPPDIVGEVNVATGKAPLKIGEIPKILDELAAMRSEVDKYLNLDPKVLRGEKIHTNAIMRFGEASTLPLYGEHMQLVRDRFTPLMKFRTLQALDLTSFHNQTLSDTPLSGNWPLRAFKQALEHAVKQGYDSVSWAKGETVAQFHHKKPGWPVTKIYDEQARNLISSYVKKMGGRVVDDSLAAHTKDPNADPLEESAKEFDAVVKEGLVPIHRVEITPEMRRVILEEGQSEFSLEAQLGQKIGAGRAKQPHPWFKAQNDIASNVRNYMYNTPHGKKLRAVLQTEGRWLFEEASKTLYPRLKKPKFYGLELIYEPETQGIHTPIDTGSLIRLNPWTILDTLVKERDLGQVIARPGEALKGGVYESGEVFTTPEGGIHPLGVYRDLLKDPKFFAQEFKYRMVATLFHEIVHAMEPQATHQTKPIDPAQRRVNVDMLLPELGVENPVIGAEGITRQQRFEIIDRFFRRTEKMRTAFDDLLMDKSIDSAFTKPIEKFIAEVEYGRVGPEENVGTPEAGVRETARMVRELKRMGELVPDRVSPIEAVNRWIKRAQDAVAERIPDPELRAKVLEILQPLFDQATGDKRSPDSVELDWTIETIREETGQRSREPMFDATFKDTDDATVVAKAGIKGFNKLRSRFIQGLKRRTIPDSQRDQAIGLIKELNTVEANLTVLAHTLQENPNFAQANEAFRQLQAQYLVTKAVLETVISKTPEVSASLAEEVAKTIRVLAARIKPPFEATLAGKGDKPPQLDMRDWKNHRNAVDVEGYLIRRKFDHLRKLGLKGILDFQTDPTSTPDFKAVQDYFNWKYRELVDADKIFRYKEKYLPQMWKENPHEVAAKFKAGRKTGRVTSKASFMFKSMLKTYAEGIALGLHPRYENLPDLMAFYEKTANKLRYDQYFMNWLKAQKVGDIVAQEDIKRLHLRPEDKVWKTKRQNGYRPMDVEIFPQRILVVKKDKAGKEVKKVYKTPVYLPDPIQKEVSDYLRVEEGIGQFFEAVARISSMSKNLMLTAGVPFTGFNMHGFNMLTRRVLSSNPRYLPMAIIKGAWDLTNPKHAEAYVQKHLHEIPDAIKHGMSFSTEEHVPVLEGRAKSLKEAWKTGENLAEDLLPFLDSAKGGKWKELVGRPSAKGIIKLGEKFGKLGNALSFLFDDPLFQKIIPAWKLERYLELRDGMIKEGIDPVEAKRTAAGQVNNIFGGINWIQKPMKIARFFRMRGHQNVMRIALLAPDWLETHVHLLKNMPPAAADLAKGVLTRKWDARQKAYRRILGNFGIMYLSLTVLNYYMNGHFMHDNKKGRRFDLQIPEDWLGVPSDPSNPKARTVYIRPFGAGGADFFKIMVDVVEAFRHAEDEGFEPVFWPLKSRLGAFPAMVQQTINQEDYAGQPLSGPNPWTRKKTALWQAVLNNVATWIRPFAPPISVAAVNATKSDLPGLQKATGFLEVPVAYARKKKPVASGSRRSMNLRSALKPKLR